MATFTAISASTISGTFKDTSPTHTIPTERIGINVSQSWGSGTGENQANQWWHGRRTLAATSENLDLVGGLTNRFGDTINLTAIKEIIIRNRSTTAAEFLLAYGTAAVTMMTPSNAKAVIWAGGLWNLRAPLDGFGTAADVADILTIDSGAWTITYDIFLLGTV